MRWALTTPKVHEAAATQTHEISAAQGLSVKEEKSSTEVAVIRKECEDDGESVIL